MKFTDKKQLQSMIEQQIKEMAISDVLVNKNNAKWYKFIINFDIYKLFIGFLLTGLMGALITQYYHEEDRKKILKREAFSHIRIFTQALYFRVTESSFLKSAIVRKVDDSLLLKKKESYDKSVKEWNINFSSNLLTFRENVGAKKIIFFEKNIEEDLVPILVKIDKCITSKFDNLYKKQKDKETIQDVMCTIESASGNKTDIELTNLITSARSCGYEISNTLFNWTSLNLKVTDENWDEMKEKTKKNISTICALKYKLVSKNNDIFTVTYNDHGAKLTGSSSDVIYLGKDCDVATKKGDTGVWRRIIGNNKTDIQVSYKGSTIKFPKQSILIPNTSSCDTNEITIIN